MVRHLLIILFCLASASVYAQKDSSFMLIKSISGDIEGAAIDNLNNLYLISSTGQIKKLNGDGDSVAVYNGIRNFGKLHSIDVSNPLKPLLFYKDFSTVVILDRLLAVRGSLDLRKFRIYQPSAIGLSYDNNIWVFDQYDNKLKKVDEQGNRLLETPDLRNLFPTAIAPQQILNDNGFVYVADSSQGVFLFDNYGAYRKRLDLKKWSSIYVANGKVIRTGNDFILVYDPVKFSDVSKPIPPSFRPYFHSFTTANRLIILNKNNLRIYSFRF